MKLIENHGGANYTAEQKSNLLDCVFGLSSSNRNIIYVVADSRYKRNLYTRENWVSYVFGIGYAVAVKVKFPREFGTFDQSIKLHLIAMYTLAVGYFCCVYGRKPTIQTRVIRN